MSLHVESDKKAKGKLDKQRRHATMSSLMVALLSFALLMLLLALWSLLPVSVETPTIVGYTSPDTEKPETKKPEMNPSQQSKPSAPSMASSRVIVSNAASPVTVVTPDFESKSIELGSGTGDDFGEGFGDTGWGGTGGSSSGFGSSETLSSALHGKFYDFKQTPAGKPNRDYPTDQAAISRGDRYVEYVEKIQRAHFSDASFSEFYKAPKELSLTNLAIPNAPASEGPEYFDVQNKVEPSGWVAHYLGVILIPEDGEYRFVGFADDYMAVMLSSKTRLVASWPDIQDRVRGSWKSTEPRGKWNSPIAGQSLICGDWLKLEGGDQMEMDLAVGERPGGKVGFVLMVQKNGMDYKKTAAGRPILPLFTTAPFSKANIREIEKKYPNYPFEWENVPVFRAR